LADEKLPDSNTNAAKIDLNIVFVGLNLQLTGE
jgi:hypothetical protein